MVAESRVEFDRASVHATCEELGEPAVLAILERGDGTQFSRQQQFLAWEWVYAQRLKREEATEKSVRDTARWTLVVALCTALVALFTFFLFWAERAKP